MPLTASVPEIKQAYRKLAMVYHPDKNNDDPYALMRFNEMKEAYEVLINPVKKELYLQERWLQKANGCKIGEEPVTAPNILIKSLELNRQIAAMDTYRMNFSGMADRIISLISNNHIDEILAQNEPEVKHAIIHSLLKATTHFPYAETKRVTEQLRKLADNQPLLLQQIDFTLEQKRKQENLSKFNGLFVILLTILLCLLIYFTSR